MRIFSRSALVATALLAGSAAAGPMDRLTQTKERGLASALDAVPLDAEMTFINKAMSGSLSHWDLLDNVVGSSGFGELLKHPTVLKNLITSDEMKLLTVNPTFDALRSEVEAGTATDAAISKGFQNTIKDLITMAKDTIETVKDPSKVADAVAKVALSDDPKLADAYFDAQSGDKDAFDTVAKAVGKDLHPLVDLDKLKELGLNANLDKLLNMDEVMHIIDQDSFTSKVIRENISAKKIIENAEAMTQGRF